MTDRIAASLQRLFDAHRIVFWYDAGRDMRDAYEAVALDGVVKVEIVNNEFGLKYRMLRQEPDTRFLVYKQDAAPPDAQNWLLDLELATATFKADQVAIWLADLNLPQSLEPVVRDHPEFYKSARRIDTLREMEANRPSSTVTEVRLKMLAVSADAPAGLDTVVEALLGQLANDSDEALRLIARANLSDVLWRQIKEAYGYAPAAPDFEDFAIALFHSAYLRSLGEDAALNQDALLVFSRWKNNRHFASAFETLSAKYQDLLKIPSDLAPRDFRKLIAHDQFEEIDRKVIRDIVHAMASQTLSAADVLKWCRARRQSHWYDRYEDVYLAIECATEFQKTLAAANLTMTSLVEGVKRYVASWFRLDQLYRQFIFHMQKSGQASLLAELFEAVENRYSNSYVMALNDAWQDQLAPLTDWAVPGYALQRDFYRDQVAAFRRKDQKVVVVISDALRFEVAEECLREIRKLNKFDAELTPMISSLPSYTALGMAALLPHETLQFAAAGEGAILSDQQSTQGTAAREKVLLRGRDGDRVKALKFDDVTKMRTDEGKTLFRDHDVVYIYHNRIDAIGDAAKTEESLPDAAQDAIEDLTKLVRKLTSANFSNILITADHGFLYQHRPLDESDFSMAAPSGEEITCRNRRFVLGRGLQATPGMKHFTSAQLGLSGDVEALIPNSINRMRVKGAGSRFVHGGATLQEIVIPVLRVGKQRDADVSQVEVQILVPGRNLISSGQTAVTFFQVQPVSEKMQARHMKAGIYAAGNVLISDVHDLTFDYVSDNSREREMPLKFLLSRAADDYNNQDVELKLQVRFGKTSRFEDYATQRFQLRRGITTDFDF